MATNLMGVEGDLAVVPDSLTAGLLTCLLAICVSSSEKHLLETSANFLTGLLSGTEL